MMIILQIPDRKQILKQVTYRSDSPNKHTHKKYCKILLV